MRYDIIIIGGDDRDAELGIRLLESGKSCALICRGRISGDTSRELFRQRGGVLMMGDGVSKVEFDGNAVCCIYTEALRDTPLQAGAYVLCSGRFFTRGLLSDMDKVFEPVFGCDVKYDPDRSRWCAEDFYAKQPFESYGVVCGSDGKAVVNGQSISNLYVCGSILCDGQDKSEEVCKSIM